MAKALSFSKVTKTLSAITLPRQSKPIAMLKQVFFIIVVSIDSVIQLDHNLKYRVRFWDVKSPR